MAHGLQLFNSNGKILIDSEIAFSTIRVVERGVMVSGTSIPIYDDPNAMLFVTPDTIGASLYATSSDSSWGYGTTELRIHATSGYIRYVKVKHCEDFPIIGGYGIAVYSNTGTPKLVFSDKVDYVRVIGKVAYYGGTASTPLAANLASSKRKYVSAYSLSPYRYEASNVYVYSPYVSFNSDGSAMYLSERGVPANGTPYGYTWYTTEYITVIGIFGVPYTTTRIVAHYWFWPLSYTAVKQFTILEC